MRVGLSIWPVEDAEWLELGLASKLNLEVSLIGETVKDPVCPLDLIIIDGDNPGPNFLGYYRALLSGFGMPGLIILGNQDSPALKAIDWDPAHTVFVPKPYEIELVLQQVTKKASTLKISNNAVEQARAHEASKGSQTLGYLSTLALADLVQMLCMSDWTGMVCVEQLHDGTEGYVYISDGKLYHANTDRFVGFQACYEMLRWGRCQYSFIEEKALDQVTIQMPWQEIMLEGARQLDESNGVKPSEGPLDISDIPDIFPSQG